MHTKKTLSILGTVILVVTLVMLLTACGGAKSDTPDTSTGGSATGSDSSDSGNDNVAPPPTEKPEETFPDFLVLHPDAFDIEITAASGLYVYSVPMMVKETTDYLWAEHEALGWETMSNPTVMGHLATIVMKMDEDRLTISMQDNELTETTRIQMLLIQQ
jgi:hypothetical protein